MPRNPNEAEIIRRALFAPFTDTLSDYGGLATLQQESNATWKAVDARQKTWAEAFLKRLDDRKDEKCKKKLQKWILDESKGKVPPLSLIMPRVFRYVYFRQEFEEERFSLIKASEPWRKLAKSCRKTLDFTEQLTQAKIKRSNEVGALADPRIAKWEGESAHQIAQAAAKLLPALTFEAEARDSKLLQRAQGQYRAVMLGQILPLEWYAEKNRSWPELGIFMTSSWEVLLSLKSKAAQRRLRSANVAFTRESLKQHFAQKHEATTTFLPVFKRLDPSVFDNLVTGCVDSAAESFALRANERFVAAVESPPEANRSPQICHNHEGALAGAEIMIGIDCFSDVLKRVARFRCDGCEPQMLVIILGASLEHFPQSIPHARSLINRVVSLMQMNSDKRWKQFTAKSAEGLTIGEIPEPLIKAAATCPLHPNGRQFRFDADEFFGVACRTS